MIQTIRVTASEEKDDLLGKSIFKEAGKLLKNGRLKKVRSVRVYRLEGVNSKKTQLLAQKIFCEPFNQIYSLNKPLLNGMSKTVEVAYKPGVMNPEVASILKTAQDLGIKVKVADSSWEYGFFGSLNQDEIEEIVGKLNLLNPTIEQIIKTPPKTLIIQGRPGKTTTIPIRKMTDKELMDTSKDKLFLNLEEMLAIQAYFTKIKRDPTDCELETIAQTWSEHCAHKTFKARLVVNGGDLPAGRQGRESLIARIKKEALKHNKSLVSAFVDNSGVMDFYEGWAICGKVETHNSPSAIEPYGGAATGSGGVFRDVLGTGKGAKAIASTDIFCFAPPDMNLSKLPPGCLPPEYLLKRVVTGVKDYGNRMGIPTNNGSVHFHKDFRAKPTVIVGAYGVLPKKKAKKGRPRIGDLIVAVGGRTGRDGIHGATFSSAEMTDKTISINSSAVQIGNAIEQKRMFDALLETSDKNLIRAITDCGAGGFSSAIGEMGQNSGVTVHLEKAPLKYQGLKPWEIWISESQERMIVAIPKERTKEFLAICKKYNVEATLFGRFDGSKKLRVYYHKKLVCNLDMKFLHHGLPQRIMKATRPPLITHPRGVHSTTSGVTEGLPRGGDPKAKKEWISILKKVLSHGNVCSKEPIVRLYDHSVQGTNSLQPFSGQRLDGPNDAVVIRPILDRSYGMVLAHGLNPILNKIDPYRGSLWAATEAISNYVAAGGNHKEASLINNYIWPFPDEESLWSLDRSVDAVVDFMKALKIPVISGKDSLSSTYRAADGTMIKIPPVLCISVFGKIKDVAKTVSSDFKKIESTIILVGQQDTEAMGGSIYFDVTSNGTTPAGGQMEQSNNVPSINLKLLPKVLTSIHKAIKSGKILSCHDISEGGLITALFEMCVGGGVGGYIDISCIKGVRPDLALFNETAGTFLIEVENEKIARELFKDVPFFVLGNTQKEPKIKAVQNKKQLFSVGVKPLKEAWKKPMQKIFS